MKDKAKKFLKNHTEEVVIAGTLAIYGALAFYAGHAMTGNKNPITAARIDRVNDQHYLTVDFKKGPSQVFRHVPD